MESFVTFMSWFISGFIGAVINHLLMYDDKQTTREIVNYHWAKDPMA